MTANQGLAVTRRHARPSKHKHTLNSFVGCFFKYTLAVPESLLARGVPQLQLDLHPGLDFERPGVEVDADRGVGHVAVNPVREALQQRRLAHGGVPEQDDPELVLPQAIHGMTRGATPAAGACLCVARWGETKALRRRRGVFTWSPGCCCCCCCSSLPLLLLLLLPLRLLLAGRRQSAAQTNHATGSPMPHHHHQHYHRSHRRGSTVNETILLWIRS